VLVIETAARVLLDTEKSEEDADLHVKLLELVRMSYRTSLNLILEGSDEAKGAKNKFGVQITVLKLATLIRSIRDGPSLQMDFVRLIESLDLRRLVHWVQCYGEDLLLNDSLQTIGLQITELINFEDKEKTEDALEKRTKTTESNAVAD